MPSPLQGRSFVTLLDFSPRDLRFLPTLATDLKAAKYGGYEKPSLTGRNLALFCERESTAISTAFDVAAFDQGAAVSHLRPPVAPIALRESVKDRARMLGRIYEGIGYGALSHATLDTMAGYAGIPVWNVVSDAAHPAQVLSDILTMDEHCDEPLRDVVVCFLGNNGGPVGNSLLVGCSLMGMDVRSVGPEVMWPDDNLITACRRIGK